MKLAGRMEDISDVLVDVRISNGMLARRHGFGYLNAELRFLRSCRKEGLLSLIDAARFAMMRVPARVIPASALEWLYRRILRSKITP